MPLADFILLLHALVVMFNVGGLLLIAAGGFAGWQWIRARFWRVTHVTLVALVTVEALLGIPCPLTVVEDALRGSGPAQTFVGRWLAALLYWQAPPWAFAVAYAGFLGMVLLAWRKWPPGK